VKISLDSNVVDELLCIPFDCLLIYQFVCPVRAPNSKTKS